jgi:heme/copper-type cytochrome/quinol oxidase subunit 2
VLSAIVLPLALGGEAVTETGGNGTLIAVISVISMVVGYVVLWALWRYVFSAKARDKRGEPPEY